MKRTLFAAACIVLLPALAHAVAFTADLTGSAGTGVATVNVVGDDVDYNIVVSGMSPTSVLLTDGADTIDLDADFSGGFAAGSVSSSQATDIVADPSAWEVRVSDGSSTLSGALNAGSGGGATMLYLPVIATVAGQGGTNFHTDGRFVNRSGASVAVDFVFWPESNGNASPGATASLTMGVNEELVLDDMATELFGVTNGKGGVSISADGTIFGSARVYNDQIAAGEGTFGQYVTAVSMDEAIMVGAVEFLSNEPLSTGSGYRSNIGWFNPNASDVEVSFSAWDADGTLLGSKAQTAGMQALGQKRLDQLWPSLADYGDLYVTFTASAPIFVYGSVVDNVSGDAIYIAATSSP